MPHVRCTPSSLYHLLVMFVVMPPFTANQHSYSATTLISLIAFVVLLALSNLGTSLAAAYLAKDTTTNESAELVDTNTREIISTQSASDSFQIKRNADNENPVRKLCTKDENGEFNCETDSYLQMSEEEGQSMIKKCKKEMTVTLTRTWHDGSETHTSICGPNMSGTFSNNRVSSTGNGITITPLAEGGYSLSGDELTRYEGDVCDTTFDCDGGLECKEDDEAISLCQSRCRKLRFGPSRLQPCLDECVLYSCQTVASDA